MVEVATEQLTLEDIPAVPLMTDTNPLFHLDPARDLLRTPFLADQRLDLLPDLIANAGLNLVAPPPQRQIFLFQ